MSDLQLALSVSMEPLQTLPGRILSSRKAYQNTNSNPLSQHWENTLKVLGVLFVLSNMEGLENLHDIIISATHLGRPWYKTDIFQNHKQNMSLGVNEETREVPAHKAG